MKLYSKITHRTVIVLEIISIICCIVAIIKTKRFEYTTTIIWIINAILYEFEIKGYVEVIDAQDEVINLQQKTIEVGKELIEELKK